MCKEKTTTATTGGGKGDDEDLRYNTVTLATSLIDRKVGLTGAIFLCRCRSDNECRRASLPRLAVTLKPALTLGRRSGNQLRDRERQHVTYNSTLSCAAISPVGTPVDLNSQSTLKHRGDCFYVPAAAV
ncbi:hypothetical protein DPEC_G00137470 [Dallia pectoralis]|uniref:Uncharacterized protein n=1 Tax=Dallia pectoralis TaxID=75939 RepID=A0ACC2GM80_DALPE|nr:hypothetical protein DPEC_G00137470 [Dallia pectoralis]